MSLERYRMIENWTEADLEEMAGVESDEYEFKSSKINHKDLIHEIQVAASAFWNSGGGVLMVGVDDDGAVDGGIPDMVGRQRLRDWVDRILTGVEPAGPYLVKVIYGDGVASAIGLGCCVLVIAYGESNVAPHMAPDKRYYVRAGAHSDPAGHFLVESIRARRRLQKPVLRGLLRSDRQVLGAVELVVMGLNDTPALDVRLTFEELPNAAAPYFEGRLPLYIPVIDRRHPFLMDASWFGMEPNGFGQQVMTLRLSYQDLAGRVYEDTQLLDPTRNIAPLVAGMEALPDTNQSLHDLSKQVRRLRKAIERAESYVSSTDEDIP